MNVDGKGSLDLSTATKLKDVTFSSEGSLRWINTAIETIKSKDLQQVTIHGMPSPIIENGVTCTSCPPNSGPHAWFVPQFGG